MQRNVLEYFEQTCPRFPDKPAVVDRERTLSFAELRRQALAQFAQAHIRQHLGHALGVQTVLQAQWQAHVFSHGEVWQNVEGLEWEPHVHA